MFRFVFVACFIAVNVNAFQWLETLPDGATVVTCSGDVIHLPFNFTLGHTDSLQEMKWVFVQADGRADEDIAIYAGGHFVVLPAFSGRVQWLGEGGITISQAGILESGNYSVEISVENPGKPLARHTRTAFVLVADAPHAEGGALHVLQTSQAVYDVSSGEWRVQLTCGKFESLGQPPVGDVVWTAPDGQVLPSTSGPINGTFTLLLPNPPSGGNYSCSLPSPSVSPAASCLPPHSQLRQGASVAVDEVKAAFVLLDARQTQMREELLAASQRQREEFENKTKDLQAQLVAKTTEVEALKNTTTDLQGQLNTKTADLQTQLDAKTTELRALKNITDKLATKISFHACLTSPFSGAGTLQPFTIIRTNEGNAFNGSSGTFVAPVTGIFLFIASASTISTSQSMYFDLLLESTALSRTRTVEYSTYDVAATVNAVVRVQKGQRVSLYSYQGYYAGNPHTCFSGVLISRDD